MNLIDFSEKYCKLCGTQFCGGIHDVVWREGCKHFQREILGIKVPTEEDYNKILDEILNWEEWKLQTALEFCCFSNKTIHELLERKRQLKGEKNEQIY